LKEILKELPEGLEQKFTRKFQRINRDVT